MGQATPYKNVTCMYPISLCDLQCRPARSLNLKPARDTPCSTQGVSADTPNPSRSGYTAECGFGGVCINSE